MSNGYFDHPSLYSFGNARSMSDNIKREKEEFKKEELKQELKSLIPVIFDDIEV